MKLSLVTEEEISEMLQSMGISEEGASQNPLTVVTNERETNGAAVLFYLGQMEKQFR